MCERCKKCSRGREDLLSPILEIFICYRTCNGKCISTCINIIPSLEPVEDWSGIIMPCFLWALTDGRHNPWTTSDGSYVNLIADTYSQTSESLRLSRRWYEQNGLMNEPIYNNRYVWITQSFCPRAAEMFSFLRSLSREGAYHVFFLKTTEFHSYFSKTRSLWQLGLIHTSDMNLERSCIFLAIASMCLTVVAADTGASAFTWAFNDTASVRMLLFFIIFCSIHLWKKKTT